MTDEERRDEREAGAGGSGGEVEAGSGTGPDPEIPDDDGTGAEGADGGSTAGRTGPRREAADGAGRDADPAGGEPGAGSGRSDDDGPAGEDGGDRDDGPAPGGWGDAISEMQNLVGDVVGDVLEGVRGAAGRRFPRVDMVRRPDGDYVVLVDLPGVDRDQVKVTTLGGELTVSGERPRPELDEGSEVLRTERGYGSFRRTLRLPPDIREEDVTARLEDGVLEVRLPRKAPSDARTVDIG